MPYLPIDPKDLGRSYEAVIRVNSQSGKGGISYLLESEHGLELPRRLQIEFSQVVQAVMDTEGKEMTGALLWSVFDREYACSAERAARLTQQSIVDIGGQGTAGVRFAAQLEFDGRTWAVEGEGAGPIDAFVAGLNELLDVPVRVIDYHEHAVGSGADAQAVAYFELRVGDALTLYGVGMAANIVSASLKAIVSGVRRAAARGAVRFVGRTEAAAA